MGIDKEGKQILSVMKNAHLRVKVLWKDGTISWVAGDAMRLQNPFLFIPYMIKYKLGKHPDFKWVNDYLPMNGKCESIYRALKTSSSSQPKFKFGIQIPQNVHYARKLDQINRDNGWDNAMGKEVKCTTPVSTLLVCPKTLWFY